MNTPGCFSWVIAALFASSLPNVACSGEPVEPSETSETAESGGWLEDFLDDKDGKFDLSEYLQNPGAFLLVPIPITEPAVGYGLGLAAVFLQPRQGEGEEGFNRPNISGAGGVLTENGTSALAVFDMRYWRDGDLKSKVFALTSSVNMDFYAGDSPDPFRYNLGVDGGQVAGEWMAPIKNASLEINYSYFEIDARLDTGMPPPLELPNSDRTRFSSVGFSFKYDSRDNIFSPQKGLFAKTTVTLNDEALGASRNFQKLSQILINFWPVGDRWVLGMKLEGQAMFGDYPFYAKPYISLRGVPMMRYQGDYVAFGELELQYKISERVRLLGFTGAGQTWNSSKSISYEQSVFSGGIGVRYRLARKFGLDVGLDIAASKDEKAIYIQFGSAWMRM